MMDGEGPRGAGWAATGGGRTVDRTLGRTLEAGVAELPREALDRLIRRLQERRWPGDRGAAGEPEAAPLTPAQERIWALEESGPRGGEHLAVELRLAGGLDLAALAGALAGMVGRHAALRVALSPEGSGPPLQRVAPAAGLAAPAVDLTALPAARRGAAWDALAAAAARRPFDLAAGLLAAALLARLGDAEHALLLVLHPLAADGASAALLVAELPPLYAAALARRPAPLAEPALAAPELARRQRERLAGAPRETLLAFWRARLAGAPPLLALAPDRPRAGEGSAGVDRVALPIAAELRRDVEALARRAEAPLSIALLAAWKAYLLAVTGEEDLVVGAPGAHRGGPEVDGLVGRFATVLPLRTHLGGDPEMRAAVARVRAAALASWAHPEIPYARLAAELAPAAGHTSGIHPITQVGFDFRRALALPASAGGLRCERLAVRPEASGMDVVLEVEELAGGALAIALAYRRDLYDRTTLARAAGHLASLLAAAAARHGGRLSDLPLLSAGERQQVAVEWNATAADYPREATVHQLFAARAAAAPDAVAVVRGEVSLTYGELARRAGRLAAWLRARGVGLETPVPLAMGRSEGAVVAMLAVLAAGGAYLPLDPASPRERLATMLEDAGRGRDRSLLLLAESRAAARLAWAAELGFRVVDLAAAEREAAGLDGAPPPVDGLGPESLAYLMYTSGSTGRPKAVAVVHRGVVRLVRGATYTPMGPGEVFLGLTAVTFDVSTFEIWGALLNGGRLAIHAGPPPSFAELGEILARHGITTLWLTAGLFERMVEERLDALRSLRRLLSGGDALPPAAVARVRRELPGVELMNGYGPTESTTFTTCWTFPPLGSDPWAAATAPVPIGRPIENTEVHVLDRRGRPAAIGVLGELAIGGDGLARGYLHRPALTAERFRPHPDRPGERLYSTGDLVRLGRDGRLEFLGRLDRQVKVRGFRVELDEVEAALAAAPGVAQAAVAVREGGAADRALVAFAAPREGEEIDPPAVLAFLRERLSEPMLPAGLVVLPELPLHDSGKVDRKALAARPEVEAPAWERRAARPPRGPVEEGIAAIWADVLGLERTTGPARRPIGADDGFFALGGHSLAAAKVTARIADRFGVELPLVRVLEAPSLAALAEAVAAATAPAGDAGGPRPAGGSEGEPAPLSPSQERLWFLVELQPESPAYNMPAALRLSGDLDLPALAAAFSAIVRRHAVLRSRFASADGAPVQIALPASAVTPALLDLTGLPEERREDAARQAADAYARRPFDLARGPLLRAAVVRLAPREHLLLATLHHITADGWSVGVLVAELAALYAGFRGGPGAASPLPALPFQYADYARWQRARLAARFAGEASPLAADLGYFRAQLAGAPALLELPADHPRPARPAIASLAAGRREARVGADLARDLAALARRHRATPFVLLLAAFDAFLLRLTGQEDLVVGSPVANRGLAATEGMIGFFVNTVALRADLSGDPSFRELESRVRKTALAAFAHQELPFERLVEDLAPARSLAHAPLVQVVFALQDAPVPPLALPGLAVSRLDLPPLAAKFDLTCEVEASGDDGLAVRLEYAANLFDAPTVERWAGHLVTLLGCVAAHPERRLSELDLLSAPEREQILVDWNATAAPAPAETILAAIARQAAAHPLALAVDDGRERLSYAALDRRADALAARLLVRGAGRGAIVAVVLPRSAASVAALLAILRIGAAYLPIDPALPIDRIAFMLEDSAAAVALAEPILAAELARRGLPAATLAALEGEEADGPRPDDADLGDLAYVIYTSGSTGLPKGTAIAHASLANLVAWYLSRCGFRAADRATYLAGPGFDATVLEIWPALAAGAAVLVPPVEAVSDPERLLAWMAAERPTVSFLPTPLAEAVLGLPMPDGLALRLAVAGGDRLHAAPRPDVPFALLNLYGPTECTVAATTFDVPPAAGTAAPPPIGRPLWNERVYVVDRRLAPVPIGAVGELLIAGAGVGVGYLGRPDLTAEKFLPDPWSGRAAAGARLYRTGDLARFRPDGALEFVGRRDHQVKVRGFRIELGEIEAALAACPGVAQAAVVARPGPGGEPRLVAYAAPLGAIADMAPEGAAAAALRAHLRGRLPDYMVPAEVVLLDSLPLTANGKVDRRALPEPERRDEAAGPARTPLEAKVIEIAAELLGRPVGVDDSFFDLGGHSLLATRFRSRLRDACGVELPLAQLFETPTPAGIAAAIAGSGGIAGPAGLALPPPISALPREAIDAPPSSLPPSPPGDRPSSIETAAKPAATADALSAAVARLDQGTLAARIAEIAAELLGRPVGVDDSFFDLGGHSLLATELRWRLLDDCGVDLPIASLFESPTPAGMAAAAADLASGEGEEPAEPALPQLAPREGGDSGLPLSFAQERLWFLDQLAPGSSLYNVAGGVLLYGDLAVPALAATFAEIVRRHEALRATFRSARGRPVQTIAPASSIAALDGWPLPLVDLAALPVRRREAEGRALALADTVRPFDLASGPLFRTALVRLTEREHLLLIALHHIVSDGWSLGVLGREVDALYPAFAAGKPSPLAPLPIQYADFAAWQRRWLQGEVIERQLAYWRERLAGLPVLALPADRPRPAVKGERGGSRPIRLPPALATAVAARARGIRTYGGTSGGTSGGTHGGTTPFMVLLLAFQALLARLAGVDDLAVGSPVANRTHSEVEGLIGFFVNSLVLRADLSGGISVADALAQVRRTCLEAYAHQDLPFDRLVEELAPERSPGHTPLFQVAFALQGAPFVPAGIPGLALAPLDLPSLTAKFDLTLILSPEARGEALVGLAEYDRELFDAATVERLLAQYQTLLARICDGEETRLAELPLLSLAERHQLLAEWNDTAADYPARTAVELFEEQAYRRPDAVALDFAGGATSYRELDRAAERLALRLREAGVGPERRAAICLPRSPEFVVAILAVQKAGGAYVPLDPAYPRERLALLLSDAGADGAMPVLVTDRARLARLPEPLPEAVSTVVAIDDKRAARIARRLRKSSSGAGPDSPAYVMYTSGSTGRPKGVVVVHRGVVRLVRGNGRPGFSPEDAWLLLSPLSFDTSSLEIWAALANGGRLVVAPVIESSGDLAPPELAAVLRERGVTATFLTAARFHQLVDQEIGAFAGVRHVHAGGDVLSAGHVRRLLAAFPGVEVTDGYGPTENSTYTSCGVARDPGEVGAAVSIGRPVANSRVVLVDRALQPVPIGVAGELLTGGDGLARGYLGRPDLTAAAFVPDPFCGSPGQRLYRVGDLARLLPDGRLEFLGRLDHQVKVRGFRIELGEVEAALAGHPRLRACAVVALPDPSGGKRLAAYVVARDGEAPRASELRAYLRERLPEHMVPSFFIPLPALPTTAHGKLDRAALPAPEASGDPGSQTAPRDALEELLAELFAEVLGVPRVGIRDSFFDLGGHSLLATQLVARLREALAVEIPLRRLFERPTVADLAADLRTGVGAARADGGAIPPIAPVPPELAAAGLPLSFAQERLWILDRFEPGSASYDIPAALRLAGPLDPAALAASLAEVVRRQGSLRTRFASAEGRPRQVVLPALPAGFVLLPTADLTGLPELARERELSRLGAGMAAIPFDLSRAPLFRALLAPLGGEEWTLFLTLHHAIGDGWSLGVLTAEISALYRAIVERRPARLAPLAVQYADYAVWQRRHRSGAALAGDLDYWRRRLAGLAGHLDLPTDRPRPAVQTFRGGSRVRRIGPQLAGRLRALGREAGTTLFMTLLAGFKLLLGRLAYETDVAVGSPVAGRGRAEVEGLVGMFLNTLVLRTDLAGDPPFAELLARVRETALGAFAHQDAPFEMLLDALQPERDLSRTPFFQVYFNLLSFPLPELALPGVAVRELATPEPPSKFDLTAYVRTEGEAIAVELVYNADLFAAARVEELLAQLERVLAQAAADPWRPIGSLSLLTPAAAAVLPDPRQALDATWRGAVHDLVSRQAAEEPARPAVSDRDGAWTYGELEAQANRLAHRLLAAGVGKGDPVAVFGHRSAALAWTVLGVLKAGAAFVLLDPAYPAARQIEILERAAPRAWLRLAAAGPLGPELDLYLAGALPPARRLAIPAWRDVAASALFADLPATPPAVEVGPGDLAYLAFTSGSTGVPKGIEGLHGSLSHFLPWMAERYGFTPADRFSMLSALAHDPLQRDLFTPLTSGASLAVPDPERLMVPGYLARWLRAEGVTVANLTPAMAQVLTETGEAGASVAPLDTLRCIFLVGDVLTRSIVSRLRRLAPRATIVNHYGSTETQRAVGYHALPPADPAANGAHPREEVSREVLPLGRGIPSVQLLVLAPHGLSAARGASAGGPPAGLAGIGPTGLAGIGEVGEIALRSPHIARGYRGDPELTKARFLPNPWTGGGANGLDRLYLTGDLGRYLPDGQAAFAGRADHQVKVRGFRIEPAEIEGRLARLPGVREAVVVAQEAAGDRRLVAFATLDPAAGLDGAAPPDAAALRARLKDQLPAYMVPAAVVVLPAIPLTENGKIDRRALARHAVGAREDDVTYRAPETDLEIEIAAILKDVLAIEQVGVDDNFFELGGNSLALVQVHARLQQTVGAEIPAVEIFNHPTVAALARYLVEAGGGGRGAAAGPAITEERTEKLREGRNRLRRRFEQQRASAAAAPPDRRLE